MFVKIFQVSADEEMVNKVNFSTQNLFQICACMIITCTAKHFEVATVCTYSRANTLLGQSERAYYLSYFIKYNNKNLIQISVNITNNNSCKLYSEQALGDTLHDILCRSHLTPVVQYPSNKSLSNG